MKMPLDSFLVPLSLNEDEAQEDVSISELYHENSKLTRFSGLREQSLRTPRALAAMANARTVYRDLPAKSLTPQLDTPLCHILRHRVSTRSFTESIVSFNQLSTLLEGANGITRSVITPEGDCLNFRASPSAGALYCTEVYVCIQSVRGLVPGIYHHNPTDAELTVLCIGEFASVFQRICYFQEGVKDAAFGILLTSNLKRMRLKYGERGYRYAMLDMGHLMQSFWLLATEMNLGFVSLGAFDDNAILDLLPINGVDDILGYVGLAGTIRSENDIQPTLQQA